jgi:DNA repair photolyase
MKVQETEARTVLVRSELPDAEYVVNPYTGCEFGCAYCYASFAGRFVGEPVRNWGSYVYAKVNAVAIFVSELARMRRVSRALSILLSSVTDPYQGAERKYRLTREILEVLTQEPYPGVVGIPTKSPVVLRDFDLLRRIPRAEVGVTITTTDDRLSRFLEVRAPLASRRLLHAEGIATYAFLGPLLPHFRYDREGLEQVFAGLAEGARRLGLCRAREPSPIHQRAPLASIERRAARYSAALP